MTSTYTTHTSHSIQPSHSTPPTAPTTSSTHPHNSDLATFSAEEYHEAIGPLLEGLEKWMQRQDSLDGLEGRV